MSSLNKVQLIGRLGKDPEMRNFDNGGCVCNFSIATSESFKGKDGTQQQKTEWHNIVLWNKPAEIAAKYLHKGDLAYIEGKITTRTWEKEGVTKYITEIVGFNLVMLGTKKTESSAPAAAAGMPLDNDFDSRPPAGYATTKPAAAVAASNPTPAPSSGGFEATDDLPF